MESRKSAQKKVRKQSVLETYDFVNCYAKNQAYIQSLPVRESTRIWIAEKVVAMQMKSSKAEKFFGEYLIGKGIDFMHKVPFVFTGFAKPQIKFVDFYFSGKRTVVEIEDGGMNDFASMDACNERIRLFRGKGIKVLHMSKEDAMNSDKIDSLIKSMGL